VLSVVERPVPASEAELIAACVAGDASAQRVLFRREYPRVHATLYRLVGGSRDVDDLVQETFVAAFRGLARFRAEAKLSTWIDRIAVRVAYAHFAARRASVSLDVVGDVADGAGTPDARAHARDGLRRLYAVLAEL